MSDVFTMLEQDHRTVETLLEQLAESEEGSEREQLVAKLTASLRLHMEFEEGEIYPRLAEVDGEMDKAGIGHHVEEEEQEAFPALRNSCDEDTVRQLGQELMQRKAQAGTLADELENASKDALLAMAEQVGIEGRSSMTKAELIEQLTTASGGLGTRSAQSLADVERECVAAGGVAVAFVADVRDAAAIDAMFSAATDRFGTVDVVVHSAAVMAYGRFE